MIEVKRYTDADADLWNKFNAESKKSTIYVRQKLYGLSQR